MPGTNVVHFGAVRMRIVGVGNMHQKFLGYDDILTEDMAELEMQQTNIREPVTLADFVSEAGRFRGETVKIREVFKINSITIYVKALWSQYPE